ncbi:MAG: hypothetical protein LBG97_06510 [Coriobacteriales bacterium]|nr:hypothetical protein [Coriobacteriales bacterium]
MKSEKYSYTKLPGNTFVQLTGELTDNDINEIIDLGALGRIQASFIPNDNTLAILNEKYFAKFPDTGFRIYGLGCEQADVSCLRMLGNVEVLSLDSLNDVSGLDSLAELPRLRSLQLHAYLLRDLSFLDDIAATLVKLSLDTKSTALDLSRLLRFAGLRVLRLHRYKKNIESLDGLRLVESLTLRGITPDSLTFINDMKSLRRLKIELGAKKDLSDLYGNTNITALGLFKISHLDNIELLGRLPNLAAVELIQLPHVTTFPDLSGHENLKLIRLDDMKGMCDLSNLKNAPALESFSFSCAPRTFKPDNLHPLLRNLSVKRCSVLTGSTARNEAMSKTITSYGKIDDSNYMDVRSALFGGLSEF